MLRVELALFGAKISRRSAVEIRFGAAARGCGATRSVMVAGTPAVVVG
jgi:hypothetical protein